MDIGKIIYNRRKKLGLTLEQVGNYVGVGKSTVAKWESGYIANIKRDKIAELAEILQLNPISLVIGEVIEKSTNSTKSNTTAPTTQKMLVYSCNGIPGTQEIEIPSDDVLNAISNLVKVVQSLSTEQIELLTKMAENMSGNTTEEERNK